MRLFLETSVQVDRVIGDRDTQGAILRNCRGCTLVSSFRVLGEFIDTLIHDTVILHRLIADSPSVGEALRRFSKFPGLRFRPRRQQRAIALFGNMTEEGEAPREEVLARLERMIDWQLLARFHDELSHVVNHSDCVKARWKPQRLGASYDMSGLRCVKENPPDCRIAPFLEEQRLTLESLVHALGRVVARDKGLREARAALQKVLAGTDVPFGTNCYVLADTIIALEAPDDAPIYTTNERHFRPLAEAIGKKLFSPQ